MRKLLISLGLVVCLLAFALPTGCPAPSEEEEDLPVGLDPYEKYVAALPEGCFPVPRDCFEQAIEEGKLNIYDWADWWPEEIFEDFSKEFGIEITRDHFAGYAEMATKIQLYPEAEYDLVIIGQTGFMRLRELGLLKEVNWNWLPNYDSYLSKSAKEIWWGLGFEDCGVPYEGAFTGYGYDTEYVDDPRIPSWAVLYEPDNRYSGRIAVLDDPFEVIGQVLIYLGYSPNSSDEEELMEAKEVLLRQKPYVMAYDSWPKRLALEGEVWMIGCWTADALAYQEGVKTFTTVWPKEGTIVSMDTYFMPKGGPNPAAAHLFMNYVFRPKVNAVLIEDVVYIPIHTAVSGLLSEEIGKWVTPPEGYMEKCEMLEPRTYTGESMELRTRIWEELKK